MSNEKVNNEYGAGQIQVLEGLEAVRRRPGMYIGSTGSKGLHHLVYEIVDNSIDEALAGYCDRITVEILPENIIRVSDNGRGIPVGLHPTYNIPAVTMVFTKLHAGGKFGGGGYNMSGGLHGVGASVVNALSDWLTVEVHDGEYVYTQSFARGDETTSLIKGEKTERMGTTISFKADGSIFEETEYEYEILLTRLREQAFLNAGIHITFTDRREEEVVETVLYYEGGISSFVEYIHKRRGLEPLHSEVIHLSTTIDGVIAEVAMQYNDSYNETLLSFANNIHTGDGGTHEVGYKTALTRVINDYARKQNYLKEGNKNFSGEDVREGLTAIISVKLQEAQFEGQTKGKLGNTIARSVVDSLINDNLTRYLEEHPAEARAIIDKSMTASKAREAAKKARELTRKKNAMENSTLPGKLADCSEHDQTKTEIYIVEGDSAGGSAKGGRDRRFQAILPLWGKMLNVEKARLDKVYNNEKLMPIVTALGCSIGEDFDLTRLRYGKVIIMADADVDGSHIRTLLLTFLFRYMRPLITEGHVYIAQPPLFKVSRGKQLRYAYRDEELQSCIDEIAPNGEKIDLQRYKGLGEMNSQQLWETTMDPERRTILKVTMEDAIAADEIFTILMGDKVAPRREFIEQNARYVKNLDI